MVSFTRVISMSMTNTADMQVIDGVLANTNSNSTAAAAAYSSGIAAAATSTEATAPVTATSTAATQSGSGASGSSKSGALPMLSVPNAAYGVALAVVGGIIGGGALLL